MKAGSIVETVADFEDLRRIWGFPYPNKGDILTVRFIEEHPLPELRYKGVILLHFEEIPNLIGVCDKEESGKPNFIELLLHPDIQEALECQLEEF